jgi:hypothetical protein
MCWIVDHTIQVARRKAMVVLRTPLTVMKQERPLQLTDIEVVSVSLKDKWSHKEVFQVLDQLSLQIGTPSQIVSDNGSDLKKGVKKFISKNPTVHSTYDVSHFISNLFKRKYKSVPVFQGFMTHLAKVKNQLQQSELAHLMPPKQRTKARFLNLGSLFKWVQLIVKWKDLNLLNQPNLDLWNKYFGWFNDHLFFVRHFSREVEVLNEIQEILKKKGLNEESYNDSLQLLERNGIGGSLQQSIQEYLQGELDFAVKNQISSCVSSDIIESLFGKYKYHSKIHSFSEINRMILILPCLCRDITPQLIESAFKTVSTKDVDKWIAENANETLQSRRRAVLGTNVYDKLAEELGKKLREVA